MNYLVSYFRVRRDDRSGTVLPADVEYGAICDTLQDAEREAHAIVDNAHPAKRGILLPRVLPFDGELIDAMYEAQEKADAIIARMNESNHLIQQGEHLHRQRRR